MSMTRWGAAQTPPKRATLIVLTAVSVLTLNLFLPSLPSMAREFGVSYGAISLAIAGYLFLSAILSLVLGPLADRYGRRPILLISFTVFALASIGAAITENYTLFLVFRMCQAVCATGSTLSRAIVRDMYPPGKGTSVLGYIAMAMAVAPMVGPLIGGLMEETLGWRSVFWLFAVLGVLSVALIWRDLGETAAGTVKTMAEQVEGYKQVTRSAAFWTNTLVLGFSVSSFFVFLAGAPLVAGQLYELSPSFVGFVMGATAVGYFIGSFITGRIAERVPLGALMIWGRWVGMIGPVTALLLVILGWDNAYWVFGLMITLGAANGISLAAANSGAMSVRPDLAGSASGLSGAIATAMGALFSAFTGAVLTLQNGDWLFCLLLVMTCGGALAAAYPAAKTFDDFA
ncbi:MAG: multidrug effflux MFS transporter [Planktotalea sp.]|uniref:multidrug effflux MFS transporter n=1 Tax=Planktotalea sp. TaxID=2029877 RepID=UPI003C78F1D3